MRSSNTLYFASLGSLAFGIVCAVAVIFIGTKPTPVLMAIFSGLTGGGLVGLVLRERMLNLQLIKESRKPLRITTSFKIPDGHGRYSGVWYVYVLRDPLTGKYSAPNDPADRVVTRKLVDDNHLLRAPFWFKDGKLIIYDDLYSFAD